MRKLILMVIVLFLMVLPCSAVNDVDMEGGIIRIGTIDGTAWTWTDSAADAVNGIYVWCIFFHPGATGDEVTVQWEDSSGIEIIHFKGSDTYDQRIWYADPAKQYKLYIDPPDLNDDALIIIHTR